MEKKMDGLGDSGADEFFGDDVDDNEQDMLGSMGDRELAALKTRLTTLGYQDGVEKGVEEVVQEGFDVGYAAGAAAGWEIGFLYGGAAAAVAALKQFSSLGRHPRSAVQAEATGQGSSSGRIVDEVGRGEVSDSGETSNPYPESDRGLAHGGNKDSASITWGHEVGEDLLQLVKELKQSSLAGPDGPHVDKAEVQRRLKLVGPAGEAVAETLAA